MKFIKTVVFASVVSLLSVSAASAGNFEAYSMVDQKSKRLVLVVSFAAGAEDTDSQVDFAIPNGYKLVSAKAKAADALCVQIPGNKIRVVSPTGGAKALAKAATDYCAFTFAAEKGLATSAKPVFVQSFVECAGLTGVKSCDVHVADITQ